MRQATAARASSCRAAHEARSCGSASRRSGKSRHWLACCLATAACCHCCRFRCRCLHASRRTACWCCAVHRLGLVGLALTMQHPPRHPTAATGSRGCQTNWNGHLRRGRCWCARNCAGRGWVTRRCCRRCENRRSCRCGCGTDCPQTGPPGSETAWADHRQARGGGGLVWPGQRRKHRGSSTRKRWTWRNTWQAVNSGDGCHLAKA